jgi:hypothetical protein
LGYLEQNNVSVTCVTTGSRGQCIASTVAKWIQPGTPALIALDTPLGWPIKLGQELGKAGKPIEIERNKVSCRLTDCVVGERIKKQPLDVGADRIARTAHAALELLGKLREHTKQAIPLAWCPNLGNSAWAIKVYLAATPSHLFMGNS